MKNLHILLLGLIAAMVAVPAVSGLEDNFQAISDYNKAVDLANAGDMNGALAQIDRSLGIQPNNSLAQVTKAGILNAMKRYDEALVASDLAVTQNATYPYGYITRADALNGLGRYREALESADKALGIDGKSPEALASRGTALLGLGRVDEAVRASQAALDISPGMPMALGNLERAKNRVTPAPSGSDFLNYDPDAVVRGTSAPAKTGTTRSKAPLPWFLTVAGVIGAAAVLAVQKRQVRSRSRQS